MSGSNTEKSDTDSGSQGQATYQQGQSAAAQEVPDAATTAQEEQATSTEESQTTSTQESQASTTQESQTTSTTQESQTTSTTQESQASTTQESQTTSTQESQATTTTTTTEESQASITQEVQAAITTTTMQLTRPWNLIYSEPFIFTDMIKSYGVQGLVVHDDLLLSQLPELPLDTTYAIILAYEYKEIQLPEYLEEDDEDADNIIFSNQVVVNSCATQSLVNILTNLDIERGQLIQGFMKFTEDMSPINRGIALGNMAQFREIHNSYGEPVDVEEDVGEGEEGKEYKTENTYHFVTYLPKNGFLWELDSLKLHPTKIMAINEGERWLNLLEPFLTNKIESDELEANLLTVVKDPIVKKEEQLANLVAYNENLDRYLYNEMLNPLEASSSTAPIRGSNLTPLGRKLQNEQLELKKKIKKFQDDIAYLKKAEADTSAKIEEYKKGNLSIIGGMAGAPATSGTGLTAHEQPSETYTPEGKGKARATPIGPKTKKAITKQGKQAILRGRGRGRGARSRGSRGRGQAKVSGKATPKADTFSTGTKADTSSTSKKGKNKKKRSFDDVESEVARKEAATKRFNLRRK